MKRLAPVLFVVTSLALLPRAAHADEKAVCLSAYEKTQTLRKDNKLRAAREQLLVCTRDVCPKLVRVDCTRWMDEVTASQPSLVLSVRDAKGLDRTDARILLDGEALPHLGQEVVVDPGPHTIRVEVPGEDPIDQEVVVGTGEKNRAVTVTLPEPVKKLEPAPALATKPLPPPVETRRPIPILVPVLGGFGVAALGVGTYLGLTTRALRRELRNTCAPHCEQDDVDTLNLRYRISGVAFGVGAVAIGVAVWMFVTRPQSSQRMTALPSGLLLRF